jgi:hypothetical protein
MSGPSCSPRVALERTRSTQPGLDTALSIRNHDPTYLTAHMHAAILPNVDAVIKRSRLAHTLASPPLYPPIPKSDRMAGTSIGSKDSDSSSPSASSSPSEDYVPDSSMTNSRKRKPAKAGTKRSAIKKPRAKKTLPHQRDVDTIRSLLSGNLSSFMAVTFTSVSRFKFR